MSEKIKLGEICHFINGRAFKPSEWEKQGLPIVRIQNLNDENAEFNYYSKDIEEKYIIDDNQLLFSWSGTPGTSFGAFFWNRGKAVLNQHIFKIIPKIDVNIKYLMYLLNGNLDIIISKSHGGVGLQHITKGELEKISVSIPEINEQEKIVSILNKITEIINARKKQSKQLEEIIKSQFVEMFGNIKEYKRLEEFSTLITKGASPKWQGIEYKDAGTLFVTSENVREGYIDISKPKYLDNKINEILPRSILKRDDILVNIVGASIGRAAKYDYDYLANINQAVALVRTKNINNIYLLEFLNSEQAIKMYDDMKKGGARENLSLKNISDLKIPDAPIELQNKFAEFVKQVDKQKFEIQQSLNKMQELYESLMDEYFG